MIDQPEHEYPMIDQPEHEYPMIDQPEHEYPMIDQTELWLVTAKCVLENDTFQLACLSRVILNEPSQLTDCTGHNNPMLRVPRLYQYCLCCAQ